MKLKKLAALLCALMLCLAGLAASAENTTVQEGDNDMQMMIGETPVTVAWEDNASVEALKMLAGEGLTVEMSMYGGFEQVASIGQSLPRTISRRPPPPATSCSIPAISWWCSMAAIPGPTPGWGTSPIRPRSR